MSFEEIDPVLSNQINRQQLDVIIYYLDQYFTDDNSKFCDCSRCQLNIITLYENLESLKKIFVKIRGY